VADRRRRGRADGPAGPDPAHLRGERAAPARAVDTVGALVVGRRLFDLTGGWGGTHPLGVPVVVVTHKVPDGWPRADAPFTFVTDGVQSGIETAKGIAGGKVVGVNGGTMARQALDAGLVDELHVELVPVLLGDGVPLFGKLASAPVELDDPMVDEGVGVTHLHYRVRKRA
jgi:dihydrofolate reductase